MRKLVTVLGAGISSTFLLYASFLYHLEPNQTGLVWNWVSGEVRLETRTGYHFDKPWAWVARIDTRPTRVCVTSAAHAAVNCKLVSFNPDYHKEFVAVEGWWYYWWANRLSFNWSYAEEYRGVRDLLRGYAFSSQQYPFITVMSEYESGE